MNFYLAPMEGITTYLYRNAYQELFCPMDKYFSPFIVPHKNKEFNAKEFREISPENNPGQVLVPQILTNCAEDFIRTAKALGELGYEEVNLNLGCPSRTVVSKKRGSGFLEDPRELGHFFEQVFSGLELKVSVKTRIGLEDPEEFKDLLQVYNEYPLAELIIHPRLQKDYYKNKPNLEVFKEAVENSVNPLCYNGDLFTLEDYEKFTGKFPQVKAVMLGRGVLMNPGLVGEIKNHVGTDKKSLQEFHDRIYNGYQETMSGQKNVLFKMKELWSYLCKMFPESEKLWKKIKKVETAWKYEAIVAEIFQ